MRNVFGDRNGDNRAITISSLGIVLGGDLELIRDQRAEESDERERRIALYEAWVERHGRIGEDFVGVLNGTASPPAGSAPLAKRPAQMVAQRLSEPCVKCERPRRPSSPDGLCCWCRLRVRMLVCCECGKSMPAYKANRWHRQADIAVCARCLRRSGELRAS